MSNKETQVLQESLYNWIRDTVRPDVSKVRRRFASAIAAGLENGTWKLTPVHYSGWTLFKITSPSPHPALPDKSITIQSVRGKLSIDVSRSAVTSIRDACAIVEDPWTKDLAEREAYELQREVAQAEAAKAEARPVPKRPTRAEVEERLFWDFVCRGVENESLRVVSCGSESEVTAEMCRVLSHYPPTQMNAWNMLSALIAETCEELDVNPQIVVRTVDAGESADDWHILQRLMDRVWVKVMYAIDVCTCVVLVNIEPLGPYGCLERLAQLADRPVVIVCERPLNEHGCFDGLPFQPYQCRRWPGGGSDVE